MQNGRAVALSHNRPAIFETNSLTFHNLLPTLDNFLVRMLVMSSLQPPSALLGQLQRRCDRVWNCGELIPYASFPCLQLSFLVQKQQIDANLTLSAEAEWFFIWRRLLSRSMQSPFSRKMSSEVALNKILTRLTQDVPATVWTHASAEGPSLQLSHLQRYIVRSIHSPLVNHNKQMISIQKERRGVPLHHAIANIRLVSEAHELLIRFFTSARQDRIHSRGKTRTIKAKKEKLLSKFIFSIIQLWHQPACGRQMKLYLNSIKSYAMRMSNMITLTERMRHIEFHECYSNYGSLLFERCWLSFQNLFFPSSKSFFSAQLLS